MNCQNESMEEALKNVTDEYNQKTQEILKSSLDILKNIEKILKDKNMTSLEFRTIKKFFTDYVLSKATTEEIEDTLKKPFDKTDIENLIGDLLTGLKRFTNSVRITLNKINNKEKDNVGKITNLAKGLKKQIINYIKYVDNVDKVLRVMDTRILFKDKNNKNLYRNPVALLNKELFPTNGHPHVKDIHQGKFTKDCYLMSSLKAIVKTDYRVIQKCFCGFEDGCTTEEQKEKFKLLDKVKIKLHLLNVSMHGSDVEIKPTGKIELILDKTGLDKDNLSSALWVHLMKKGILAAIAKCKPLKNSEFGDFKLENGNNNFGKQTEKLGNIIYDLNDMYVGGIVNGMVVGLSTIIPLSDKNTNSANSVAQIQQNNIERIKKAIESGNVAITVGSVRDSELPQGFKPPKGWIGSHLYCLDGFENGCFVLSDTRINSAKEVLIAEKDFFKLFDQINFADVKYNSKNQDAIAPKANGKVVENDPGQDENSSSLVIQ